MPARSDGSVSPPSDDDHLEFEPCEANLAFSDYDPRDPRGRPDELEFWQCQRPIGHIGRHHSWAIESGTPGFDADEVEMWWPNPNDPERLLY